MNASAHFLLYLAQFFLEWEILRINVEKIIIHILYSITFLENRTVYEIMWKSIEEPGRPQMTIWRMCIVCWIQKATNTISEYAILISFPLHQWLHESASMLRHTYIAHRVYFSHRWLQQRIRDTSQKQGLFTYLLKPNCLCINIFLSSYISFCLVWSVVGRVF
jgi:hypothetical protein